MPSTTKFDFDLAVAYRICPKLSGTTKGLPVGNNKFTLVGACIQSFLRALGPLRCKIWVVLDGCPSIYADLCRQTFTAQRLTLIETPGVGNRSTFDRQIDILSSQSDAEVVYFAEDDYLYEPNCFPQMISFLRSQGDCDFVTPYDHPDCYTLDLHQYPKWLRVFADHHWRTAASTCLTFMTTRAVLQAAEREFRSYARGNFDASLWLSLTKPATLSPIRLGRYFFTQRWLAKIVAKAWMYGIFRILFQRRHSLWVPVPGFATHLDAHAMSPGIDWNSQMQTLLATPKQDICSNPAPEASVVV
jgi:hypothetical protein